MVSTTIFKTILGSFTTKNIYDSPTISTIFITILASFTTKNINNSPTISKFLRPLPLKLEVGHCRLFLPVLKKFAMMVLSNL